MASFRVSGAAPSYSNRTRALCYRLLRIWAVARDLSQSRRNRAISTRSDEGIVCQQPPLTRYQVRLTGISNMVREKKRPGPTSFPANPKVSQNVESVDGGTRTGM